VNLQCWFLLMLSIISSTTSPGSWRWICFCA
jgi:hypothetical protein